MTGRCRASLRSLTAVLVLALASVGLHLVPAAAACAATPAEGYRMLFDGTQESLAGWTQSGPGAFALQEDCSIESSGGLGLLWYGAEEFSSYTLRLEWKIDKLVDNSGIFVGFPDAGANTHNAAISEGYEIQIDQLGRSDGQSDHITGAIYDIQGPNRDTRLEVAKPTDWNLYEITVDHPQIIIRLNGVVVNEFTSIDTRRDLRTGFVGLQNHGAPDTAFFRNVQIKEIPPGSVSGGGQTPNPATGTLSSLRNNVGIAQNPASNANFDGVGYSYSAPVLQAVGVRPGTTLTADGLTYTWPATGSGANDNVIARGQTIPLTPPTGATKLGFLGVADHGPSTGKFVLSYTDALGNVSTVEHALTFSDWTLNGGGAVPSAGNTEVVEVPTRVLQSAVPDGTKAYVYSVTLPVDPTKTLTSVKLPIGYSGQIHIFDLAVA